MGRRRESAVHGLVLVDKEPGWTSHDVVARLRRELGTRQVGHSGTLDPDATGLLVVAVGNGTRLLRFLGDMDKTYTCEIVVGSTTDTLDDSGTVTATFDVVSVDLDTARDIARSRLTGEIMQVPPMVSALHHEGRRLHELAREGIEVERYARPVRVDEFSLEATGSPTVLSARIVCGAGTYVRVLGADLGEMLGAGAHIRALRRTGIGPWSVAEACTVEGPVVRPLADLVRHLNSHVLDASAVDDTRFGRVRPVWDDDGPWVGVDQAGEIVAVFEEWRDGLAKPTVVFGGR
jgi:tRNA pseudouridine55 synthase